MRIARPTRHDSRTRVTPRTEVVHSKHRGVSWARALGQLVTVRIEGPGHYGAGLARHLRAEGIALTEVGRPKRQTPRPLRQIR